MGRRAKPNLSYEEISAIHAARQNQPKHGSGWIAIAGMITKRRSGEVSTPSIKAKRSVSARWVKEQYESRINQIQDIVALHSESQTSEDNAVEACYTVNRASTPNAGGAVAVALPAQPHTQGRKTGSGSNPVPGRSESQEANRTPILGESGQAPGIQHVAEGGA